MRRCVMILVVIGLALLPGLRVAGTVAAPFSPALRERAIPTFRSRAMAAMAPLTFGCMSSVTRTLIPDAAVSLGDVPAIARGRRGWGHLQAP
ncbi:MAG: hypothetical protein LC739_12380 [Actinobacteria bacterium]|nr:hypothetical protein [Actinomycetota bacterium]